MVVSCDEVYEIVSSTKPMMERLQMGFPVESCMMQPAASSSYSWKSFELMNVNIAGEDVLPWLGP